MVLRQHWFVFAARLTVWFLFVAVLIIGDILINRYAPLLLTSPYVEVINLLRSIYLMAITLGLLIMWVMYYLNVQIVTNERVVDITQTSLIHHTVSELHLNKLEDVTAEVKGVIPTFLDYGDVYIQTAGETNRFEFCKVPNPTAVEKLILDLYEQMPPEQKNKGD